VNGNKIPIRVNQAQYKKLKETDFPLSLVDIVKGTSLNGFARNKERVVSFQIYLGRRNNTYLVFV
jgi:hypothetical protein